MMMKTCCFTGHRRLPAGRMEHIVRRLDQEVERLLHEGVTDFFSGGAIGFDLIAASLVIAKRESGREARLIFALPCRDQEKYWSEEPARLYRKLLGEADEIRYVSEKYSSICMEKRNCYLVNHADYCLCCLFESSGGTFQTVNYALRKGLPVVNVAL